MQLEADNSKCSPIQNINWMFHIIVYVRVHHVLNSLQYPVLEYPYTKTNHTICSYASYVEAEYTLSVCDEGYVPEIFVTFNATGCECLPVNSDYDNTTMLLE